MKKIEELCNEYRENKRLIEELTAENERLKAAIIDAMQGAEVVSAGACKVSYKLITSNRFDGAALRKAAPDVYAAFTRPVQSHRFLVV